MLATLAGFLALLLGLLLLLLPLVITELSRPRDSVWGAVVLLLGLVLVTSAERLTGAPMLAVLCGGLLVGRLGVEVAQGRWRALSDEERQALRSAERWNRSFHQLAAVAANLVQSSLELGAGASVWLAERRQGRSHGKRWVRSEIPAPAAGSADAAAAPPSGAEGEAGAAAGSQAERVATPAPDLQAEPAASPVAIPAGADAPPAAPAASSAASFDPQSASPAPLAGSGDAVVRGTEAAGGDGAGAAATDGSPAQQPEHPAAATLAVASARDPLRAEPQPTVHEARVAEARVVDDFNGVDALLAAAADPGPPRASMLPQSGSTEPPPQRDG